MVAPLFSRVDVRDVKLYERNRDTEKCITDRDGRVGEAAWVYHYAVGSIIPRFLDPVDDCPLPVTSVWEFRVSSPEEAQGI